jgi:hypothetical protein
MADSRTANGKRIFSSRLRLRRSWLSGAPPHLEQSENAENDRARAKDTGGDLRGNHHAKAAKTAKELATSLFE